MSPAFRKPHGRLRAVLTALGAAALLTVVAGCSALGGSSAPQGSTGGSTGGGGGSSAVEHPDLAVGVLPIVDVAAIQRAQAAGYFSAEGLKVELVTVQSGAVAIPQLVQGSLDMTWTNYTSVIQASQTKVGDLRVLNAGYQAAAGSFLILASPDSGIRTPQDLAGKKLAINAKGSVTELIARSALQASGVDPNSPTYVEIAFPDMPSALANHQVDATVVLEPYQSAEKAAGATTVLDAISGPTAGLSIAGIATTAKFVQDNPNTVAAFQRAVGKAQAEMADRATVEQVLPTYTKITAAAAKGLNLGTWPATVDAAQLQNVADLMTQFGMLPQQFDVKPLLAGTTPG
jgi:NitT/TauT family transport system substrate-binding protein